MILEKIILTNFRQFYGEQTIKFATDKYKNVTLLHAENGVGKTTLLNALLWCFYKETTLKFENPESILSIQAEKEDIYITSVEVYLEHDGKHFRVIRKLDQRTKQENFDAFVINDGNHVDLSSATNFVRSVIPKEMAKYFFFDGEYAETFAGNNNKKEVSKAVEDMLGCNIANQTISDLNSINKSIENEIGQLTKNNQGEVFQKELDRLLKQDNSDKAEVISIEENIEFLEKTQKEIQIALRNSDGAKDIQARRDKLTLRKDKAAINLEKALGRRTKWISQYSFGLYSGRVNKACSAIINDAKFKGALPSKIAETFVNDILNDKSCICDRPFDADSSEEDAIKKLLAVAGTAIMNDRVLKINAKVASLAAQENTAIQEFQDVNAQILTLRSEIDGYEAELKECSELLKKDGIKEIAEREEAQERNDIELKGLVEKKGRLSQSIDAREAEISNARAKRNKFLKNDGQAKILQDKSKLVLQTIEYLKKELELYKAESRQTIISKVNKILDQSARRDYEATIDENFNLKMLYKGTETSVGKSGGENQLLSIAFIASLVSFASDRTEDKNELLKPGTMAPLMLDSPFGQLDPTYRKSTAQFLPNLSNQVILLVSQSQGDHEVLSALDEKIGEEYVLISENITKQGEKPSDLIEINGKQIQCSLYEQERNQTVIRKVSEI